ncbi:hypothetical protein HanIR_Chr12g0582361 [Helianthus annuus]|nr:hypothetical protein HanIR_Chr12g0582361 [Helianthus annuus]
MAFYVKLNKPMGLIFFACSSFELCFCVDVSGHRSMACEWVFRFFFIWIFIFIVNPLFSVIDQFSSSKSSSRTKNTKCHMTGINIFFLEFCPSHAAKSFLRYFPLLIIHSIYLLAFYSEWYLVVFGVCFFGLIKWKLLRCIIL